MAKKKKKKKGRKKTLPAALRATRACALEAGIKPFKKWTPSQKKKVRSCVDKRLRRAK